jgi:hypothetical protein
MNAKKSTFGTDPQRMADMLGEGSGADPGDLTPDEAREDQLSKRLVRSLPLTETQANDLAAIAGEFRQRLPLQGRALLEVILDEETELEVFVKIKEYGKALSTATESEVDRDVGLTIYYAAIASAILYSDQAITSYSFGAIADAFGTLIDKPWMYPKLAWHFAKAGNVCRKKVK